MDISKHAYKRAKSRLGWKKNTLYRMSKKAIYEGVTFKECHGDLRSYLKERQLSDSHSNHLRVYGQNLYLFHNVTLITIYELPNDLKKMAIEQQRKIKKEKENESYHKTA